MCAIIGRGRPSAHADPEADLRVYRSGDPLVGGLSADRMDGLLGGGPSADRMVGLPGGGLSADRMVGLPGGDPLAGRMVGPPADDPLADRTAGHYQLPEVYWRIRPLALRRLTRLACRTGGQTAAFRSAFLRRLQVDVAPQVQVVLRAGRSS